MRFEDLPIPAPVLDGIRDTGFTECTPVQEAALPLALAGKDVAAQAQTGTGKTAVFLIAILSRMLARPLTHREASPRALVIAPTRELALQICAEAERLGRHTGFSVLPVFGGMDYQKQRKDLAKVPDILIGTPGRLIDYLKQKVYHLRKSEFLVIDEADRMFDMGFISDIRFLLRRMAPYNKRQNMLFSATLSARVMELCYEHMNLPEKISVTPGKITVDAVAQELYHVGMDEKVGLLLGVLKREHGNRILLFVNMKVTAVKIEAILKANGYEAAAITGDLPQQKRLKLLSAFKSGDLQILVATDVAARGLHIDDVTHVINYDLPQDPEDYVHRIGRTARAGAEGKAISLACERYVHSLEDIENFVKYRIPVAQVTDDLVVTDYVRLTERRGRGRRPASKPGKDRAENRVQKPRQRSRRRPGGKRPSGPPAG